jgi:hypothetical protein
LVSFCIFCLPSCPSALLLPSSSYFSLLFLSYPLSSSFSHSSFLSCNIWVTASKWRCIPPNLFVHRYRVFINEGFLLNLKAPHSSSTIKPVVAWVLVDWVPLHPKKERKRRYLLLFAIVGWLAFT